MATKQKVKQNQQEAVSAQIGQPVTSLKKYYYLFGLLTFFLFANTLGNGYNMDDGMVTRNHPLTSKGLSAISEIFTSPYYSDAMGYAYGVPDLARACVAMGIDGLLIEAHPNPKVAKSDASQQLNYEEFKQLQKDLQAVAASVGYKMI